MIKNSKVYFNQLNQKLYDSPAVNQYPSQVIDIIPPTVPKEIKYMTGPNISYDLLTFLDNGAIKVKTPGMYSFSFLFRLENPDNPDTQGLAFSIDIILNRVTAAGFESFPIARDTSKILAPDGEGSFERYRTLNYIGYFYETDEMYVFVRNNFLEPTNVNLQVNEIGTSIIVNRIY